MQHFWHIDCALYLLSVPQPSNLPWPQSLSFQNRLSERYRDISAKSWSQLAGSGPVPWKQAPSLFNSASSSDQPPDVHSLGELSNNFDKIYGNERLTTSSLEKKNEDLSGLSANWNAKLGSREMVLMNGNTGYDVLLTVCFYSYKV
jgi:hypothetical protein